jgi:opacity protein-like surface antigen
MRHTSPILAAFFAVGLMMLTPARAAADVFLSPSAGASFLDGELAKGTKGTFGAGIGAGGLVSFEFEGARTTLGGFTDVPVVDLNARVSTFMGNVMVRLPGGAVQPYATVGAGLVRLTGSVDVPFLGSVFSASADDIGWNFGGGVMFFPSEKIGLRADIRRFQTGNIAWDDITSIGGLDNLPLPEVNFWRETGGVTFKF